MSQNTKTVF